MARHATVYVTDADQKRWRRLHDAFVAGVQAPTLANDPTADHEAAVFLAALYRFDRQFYLDVVGLAGELSK